MDFDSPDVEKDFPGLYASEGVDGKSKKNKEEIDSIEPAKRKDKKDKGKDRGYAALEGESSPEEETNTTKSKKSKTFKFTTSKSKEKREKSRDKEKKEKDKKDKKSKQPSTASEEVLELGDVQPVFGVSISIAIERSRCHDDIDLPLVIRECIDYLQEFGLKCEYIYKADPIKTRIMHYKRLYNNRERQPDVDELDVPTACSLIKLFFKELPEPILTTDLLSNFEEVASHRRVTEQETELKELYSQLPSCNKTLLAWMILHFEDVIQHEKYNKLNAQTLAMLISPLLQMSHRLMVALLCHSSSLFGDFKLVKYIPPLTSSSPKLPENPDDIQTELRKQESLLAQIHAEMNAGFVTKKREEQLWEVQRIITQLKRKYRAFEKRHDKSIDELQTSITTTIGNDTTDSKSVGVTHILHKQKKLSCSDDESIIKTTIATIHNTSGLDDMVTTTKSPTTEVQHELTTSTSSPSQPSANTADDSTAAILKQTGIETSPTLHTKHKHPDGLYVDDDSGFLMLPRTHPEYANLIRLQLENQELIQWKSQLQARISSERAEILRFKQSLQIQLAKKQQQQQQQHCNNIIAQDEQQQQQQQQQQHNIDCGNDYEKVIENYMRENALLEQKKLLLAHELFEERRECISLQVELAMKQF